MVNRLARAVSGFVPLAIVLASCAPATAPTGQLSAAGSGLDQPQRPKILAMGVLTKVATIDGYTGEGGTRSGAEMLPLLNNLLTVVDRSGQVQPELALEVPSIDKGTWQILPDGRMVMTWKLRPGVKWHDGTPFTSDDMLFSLQLHKDPDLAHAESAIAKLMESAAAPDSNTFVVTWSSIYVDADQAPALAPNARHYLEADYLADKEAFVNSAKYRDQYIGLGPYRMAAWDGGLKMELARFDEYWQGRPLLDRIVINIISDTNAVVAQILSGAVDVIMPTAVGAEGATEVKRRWEGTGNVTRIAPVPILEYIEPMTRPEYAKPSNGMPQLAVRQAMMFGIDRTGLTEAITLGLGPVADTHWFPYDALYPQLESAAFKYPYDPDHAKQLLAQAGWEPGADGILVHRPSGERFETEVMVNQTLPVKVGDILAADWKQLGIVAAVNPISPARSTDRAYQAQRPGPYATYAFGTPPWSSYRLYGKELASEANRWSGRNRVGYQNPRSDAVLEQLLQTVDPAQRLPLLREQVQIYTTDAALMPLYWEVRTALMLQSVKADIQPFLPYWNAFSWDKEAS